MLYDPAVDPVCPCPHVSKFVAHKAHIFSWNGNKKPCPGLSLRKARRMRSFDQKFTRRMHV